MIEKNHKGQQGFTLLEILLAISVLSIMMMLIFTLTTESTNTIDRVVLEDRDYMQVETALAIVDRDFQNFYNPLFTEALPILTEEEKENAANTQYQETRSNFPKSTHKGKLVPLIDSSDKQQLIFMTAGHQRRIENAKQSNYAWVRYSIQSVQKDQQIDGKSGMFRLLRQYSAENPYRDGFDWDKVKPHILLDNLKSLSFSYWDQEKKDYVDSLDNISSKQLVARLIRLELIWIDRNNLENQLDRSFRALNIPFDASEELKKNTKKKNFETTPADDTSDSDNTPGADDDQ